MRPYSLYLESVKKPVTKRAPELLLNSSTPPMPKGPRVIAFALGESRRSEAMVRVRQQIAELTGASCANLALTMGASSGFLHALSSVTENGESIAIESPSYEPFTAAARYLGLRVRAFRRTGDFAQDFLRLKSVRRHCRVLVISNPQSPTGLLYSRRELSEIARIFDHVIIDEIFLPLFAGEISRAPARAIALSGLSKTMGLSSLRLGWIVAPAAVIRSCEQIALNTYTDLPTLPLVGASVMLPRWQEVTEGFRVTADRNRPRVRAFGERHPGVLSHDFSVGHFGMMRVPSAFASSAAFVLRLRRHSIAVCPGESFGMPHHVRISLVVKPSQFAKAFSVIEGYY